MKARKSYLVVLSLSLILAFGAAQALEKGQAAPGFSLKTVAGDKTVSLKDYLGKVVYLDFWASWCAPCRGSFPLLNKLHNKYKDKGLVILGVNVDEDTEQLNKFIKMFPVDFTLVRDAEFEIPEVYGVSTMPSSFVIDQEGKIQVLHKGFRDGDIDVIEQHVVDLLAGKKH